MSTVVTLLWKFFYVILKGIQQRSEKRLRISIPNKIGKQSSLSWIWDQLWVIAHFGFVLSNFLHRKSCVPKKDSIRIFHRQLNVGLNIPHFSCVLAHVRVEGDDGSFSRWGARLHFEVVSFGPPFIVVVAVCYNVKRFCKSGSFQVRSYEEKYL